MRENNHIYKTNSYTLIQSDMSGLTGYNYNTYSIINDKIYWTHKQGEKLKRPIGGYKHPFIVTHCLRYCGSNNGKSTYTDDDYKITYPVIKTKNGEYDLNKLYSEEEKLRFYLQESDHGVELFDNINKKYWINTHPSVWLFSGDYDIIEYGHIGNKLLKLMNYEQR